MCLCSVRLFDSSTLAPLAILREHTETVQCVALGGGPAGYVASGAKDGKVALYQMYPEQKQQQGQLQPGDATSSSVLQKHAALYSSLHPATATPPSTSLLQS